jgi:UDP-N-acetylglucosamine 2-epimerase
MKIVTVIGTRPQYTKLKPLHDYFKKNNIDNYIIDTNQHYSANVSGDIIKDLELEIDCNLCISSEDEISFMANGLCSIHNKLKEICDKDTTVLVMGDTNSTLISSIVAKKMGLRLAHIEAGIRSGDHNNPEEINRIMTDSISDVHFISRECDSKNVANPIYVGDLEYSFLNSIENNYEDISYDGSILLTIHRQENMNISKLNNIFNFCESLEYPIVFPMHHRTANFIRDNNLSLPDNIEVVDSVSYMEMISLMRGCRAIITDSGGVSKTAPFFGKKVIVAMDKWGWHDLFIRGYAINKLDAQWFHDYKISRDVNFYYVKNSCESITNNILKLEE